MHPDSECVVSVCIGCIFDFLHSFIENSKNSRSSISYMHALLLLRRDARVCTSHRHMRRGSCSEQDFKVYEKSSV